MNKFWIILTHTYLSKLKSKSFIVTTSIMVVLLIGATNINNIINYFNKDQHDKIAVIDKTGHIYKPLAAQMKKTAADIKLVAFNKGANQAEDKVENGTFTGYMIIKENDKGVPSANYYAMKITDENTSGQVKQALQQIKVMKATQNLGLDPSKVAEVYSPVDFNKTALDKSAKNEKELTQARVIVYVLVLLIYMTVLMYGSMIATEIATEKSSRVMELIVSSVSPVKHMLGKVLAIGLLGLTQYLVFILVGYSSVKAGQSQTANGTFNITNYLDINNLPTETIIFAVVFFFLGYFFYATLLAMIGSLVSRVEDVGQAISPITMLVMATFFIAMYGLFSNPESPFITVMSFIPFFTPIIMFLRIGMLSIPLWEIGISVVIMLASIILLISIGTRIYKGGVLTYNSGSMIKLLKGALKVTKES
ncbi:ABC-2 type transport system permease protein [Scopulibacillus darangshiensis]|uniref:ABC-2 type transport system permease protein n=1 Tax=Scopulibacillus darangshiensis TaxID=442528 RepID=A0A4R2P521_9BACL|nr:ABC transporter permease [Scopulibacillus darangshiensis]TCP29288.1 ABC-2 type transport system permease protein [Scopulibacillus darangshiensis]